MKRTTTDEFIKKAKEVHGDKYDYSKVNYVSTDEKVCIICHEHGEFWQTPYKHIKGNGCPRCAGKNKTTKDIIKEFKEIHGDLYDYSKVEYVGTHKKVCIICPEHGEFWQTPANHIGGKGCPKCAGKNKTTDEFIKEAREVHGDKYDYSKSVYNGSETKTCIICKKHGEFWQTPYVHIKMGCGCPKCGGHIRYTIDDFINAASKVHGEKYDYSKVEYVNNKRKVCIICPEHGEFWQTPREHLSGCGCPKCSRENSGKCHSLNIEDFIRRGSEMHKGQYDYSLVRYKRLKEKVRIICPKHGLFIQEAFSHLSGCGCPICGHSSSRREAEIAEYIKQLIGGDNVTTRDRSVIPPKEIDIYVPEFKIGVEYNGLVWHSERFNKDKHYHIDKLNACNKKGIKLIQIFEDEYTNHKEIVNSKLNHILGQDNNLPKIYARRCSIREISYKESANFLEQNHIQGKTVASVYLGCFYDDKLVGVMTFKQERKDSSKWELSRFAGDISYVCCGVGGKLFKYFVNLYKPSEVKSFADRRWTTNECDNLYTKLGFRVDGYTNPDYHYYSTSIGAQRIHKFNMRREILIKKYGADPNDSESEMTRKLGFEKVWDCGLIRYLWRNDS